MGTYRAFETPRLEVAQWRKSAYSANTGECVEVAALEDGGRAIRDSKDPAGPNPTFTVAGWTAFTAAVKADQFS